MTKGILSGVKVLEMAGIGPGPFCAMLLADLGAEVIVIERPGDRRARPEEIYNRGKKSIILDLKTRAGQEIALELSARSDVLIEGMRPGTIERLNLGPEVCLERNSALVFARITGWGQDGPLARAAGHDSNYTALAGALWFAGVPGTAPLLPSTLTGDVAGGALYLAIGILAALLRARSTGQGEVVDAAIVDGAAHSMNLLLAILASVGGRFERGLYAMDAAHWAGRSYRCSDGAWINISPLEPKFYSLLIEKLGLQDTAKIKAGQFDSALWPELTNEFEALFAAQPSAYWCKLLEGTDACFAPVLSPLAAAAHPHIAARGIYSSPSGVLQAAPAPRFKSFPVEKPADVPPRGSSQQAVLASLGLGEREISNLANAGAFG